MENSLKEIEVKAKINDFDEVVNKLIALGCTFSEPLTQVDSAYFLKGITFNDFKQGVNAVRIRLENEKAILTVKQRQEVALANIEKEVSISDAKTMEEILFLLGFYKFITVSKVRRKSRYKDYEICLDDVVDLGKFIEIEKMSNEPSEAIQEELFQFLESLGIKREARASRGYDVLLYQKLHGVAIT